MAFNKANIDPLDDELRDMANTIEDTRALIRRYKGAEEITNLTPAQETAVLANLKATATPIKTHFEAAEVIFLADNPV